MMAWKVPNNVEQVSPVFRGYEGEGNHGCENLVENLHASTAPRATEFFPTSLSLARPVNPNAERSLNWTFEELPPYEGEGLVHSYLQLSFRGGS